MGVKLYSTSVGVFCIIQDTIAYQNVLSLGTGNIYTNISLRNDIINFFINYPVVTTPQRIGNDETSVGILRQFFPLMRNAISYSSETVISYDFDALRNFKLNVFLQQGYSTLQVQSFFSYGGTILPNLGHLYPLSTPQTGSQVNHQRLSYDLLIVNDDFSSGVTANFYIQSGTYYTFGRTNISSSALINLKTFFEGISPYNPNTDPYSGGGTTEPGGGEGDLDDTSDPIDEANLPTLTAVDARFISIYTPTLSELNSLASYLWSGAFDLDTFKKLFADPMQAILGLSIVPIAVPSTGQQVLTIGNISTGVSLTKATTQYIQLDCGTLNVNEYWGAYLDYSPYTRLEIYLPYIGTKELNIDDVMNKPCHLFYNIDVLTGACVAMIKCGDSVLYSYAGQCATPIPITGSDWTNVIHGTLNAAMSTAAIVAGAVSGAMPLTAAGAVGVISSSAQNAMNMKPMIEKSGSLGGSAGMLGVQKPYLILTRPRQALPENQNHYTGYPNYITSTLGDLTGMTFIEQVHLENIPCTSAEQSEIETLLKGGVIF